MVQEYYYIAFILGYDLLADEFGTLPCDIAFETAIAIARDFLSSRDYFNMDMSMYDALRHWLDNNRENILVEIEKQKKIFY